MIKKKVPASQAFLIPNLKMQAFGWSPLRATFPPTQLQGLRRESRHLENHAAEAAIQREERRRQNNTQGSAISIMVIQLHHGEIMPHRQPGKSQREKDQGKLSKGKLATPHQKPKNHSHSNKPSLMLWPPLAAWQKYWR